MKPMNRIHKEEVGTLTAQEHVAHDHEPHHHQQVDQVYHQVYQQVWMRMGSSCLFLGPGRRCLLLGRYVASWTSNAIMMQCGKATVYIGTFWSDIGTLDMRYSYASHTYGARRRPPIPLFYWEKHCTWFVYNDQRRELKMDSAWTWRRYRVCAEPFRISCLRFPVLRFLNCFKTE